MVQIIKYYAMKQNRKQIFLIALIIISVLSVKASTITSTNTGGFWSEPDTWIGGIVPTINDDVIIAGTINVCTGECNDLTINNGITLNFFGVGPVSSGYLDIDGDLLNNGLLNYNGGLIIIFLYGNLINNGSIHDALALDFSSYYSQTISGSSPITFGIIEIVNGQDIIAGSDIEIEFLSIKSLTEVFNFIVGEDKTVKFSKGKLWDQARIYAHFSGGGTIIGDTSCFFNGADANNEGTSFSNVYLDGEIRCGGHPVNIEENVIPKPKATLMGSMIFNTDYTTVEGKIDAEAVYIYKNFTNNISFNCTSLKFNGVSEQIISGTEPFKASYINIDSAQNLIIDSDIVFNASYFQAYDSKIIIGKGKTLTFSKYKDGNLRGRFWGGYITGGGTVKSDTSFFFDYGTSFSNISLDSVIQIQNVVFKDNVNLIGILQNNYESTANLYLEEDFVNNAIIRTDPVFYTPPFYIHVLKNAINKGNWETSTVYPNTMIEGDSNQIFANYGSYNSDITLSASIQGNTYQWYKDGKILNGWTGSVLRRGMTYHELYGDYYCLVDGIPSRTITLTGLSDLTTLKGKVTNADSGSPVAGATISLGENSTITDSNGNYKISGFAPPKFHAAFSATPTSGIRPQMIHFTDCSSSTNYVLQASAENFSSYENNNIVINMGDTLSVDIAMTPLNVLHEDFSHVIRNIIKSEIESDSAVSWNWNFGDGIFSTKKDPYHTYTHPGLYSVQLFVKDNHGYQYLITKPNLIQIEDAAETFLIYENFDHGKFLPTPWWSQIINNDSTWRNGNLTDHLFNSVDLSNVYSAICSASEMNHNEWLITSKLKLIGVDTAAIEFYVGYNSATLLEATLKLYISIDDGENWTQIWEAYNDNLNWDWRKINIDLKEYIGNIGIIAWQYVGKNGDNVAIDNIKIAKQLTGIVENKITINPLHLITYPNPLSKSITIEYHLNKPKMVKVTFFNQFGEMIDIIEKNQLEGNNQIVWTPDNYSSGVYFFNLQAGEIFSSGKIIIVR